MAFKATKNANVAQSNTTTFKATRNAGYSNTYVYKLNRDNKSALDLLTEYNNRINAGTWLSSEDRAKYKSAIDTYTSTGNSLRDVSKYYGTKYTDDEEKSWLDSLSSLNQGYSSINDFYNQFASDKEYGAWQTNEQKRKDFESVLTASDFAQNSVKNWNTPVNYADVKEALNGGMNELSAYQETQALRDKYMTETEWGIYYYYLNKGDTKKAEEYLAWNDGNLKQRAANKYYNAYDDTALELLFSAASGVDQFFTGLRNVGHLVYGEQPLPPPTSQYVSSAMAQNNTGVWKVANDLTQTLANQLPSIGVSVFTGGTMGGVTMGMSAAGNSYGDMVREGYETNQARAYGIMTGASEFALSKALGGISNLGGNGSGVFQSIASKVLPKVNNAIGKVAIKLGGNMLDEGLEEGVQTVLEPLFKHAATLGESKLSEVDWEAVAEEALYSALLGGLSAGVFEGTPTIANAVSTNLRTQKAFGSQAQNIVADALELNPNDKMALKAQKTINKGKQVSGLTLDTLLNKTDTAKVREAVADRLTQIGEKGDVSKLSNVITKQLAGEDLSISESKLLKNSKTAQRVLSELNPEHIVSGQYTSGWAESIGTRRLNADVYSRRPSTKVKTKDGAENTINNVRSVADGVATVELADGKVAKVGLDKGITSDVVFNDPKAENLFRIATDRVGKVDGWTTETANAMIKGYDGTTSDVDYRKAYTMAFYMGKEGVETSQVVSLANKSGVKGATLLGAYDMGRQANEKTLTNTAQSGKIESEVKTDESTNTYLRNGSEWNGSANPEGQVSILEESTGRDTSREDAGRKVADSEAVKLVNEGRKVRVADLGILNGSKTQTVTVVDKSQETAEMTKAREKAESRGVKVRFFLGDNLVIEENGELISARAYIKGDYVFVRADHPLYTADQLMSHEMGHDMVAKGEVDINKVRERLAETVGKENIDLVADMYELAYRGSNLSADEIWEECICDSLGNMNVFSGKAEIDQGIMTMVLADIKKATEDTKIAPNKTRGAPDGKASREAVRKKKKNKVTIYLSTKDVGTSNMQYINKQLLKLYRGLDSGIADGIAIENEGIIFIVDSGKENGVLNFAVRKRIKVSNEDLRLEYIRRTNNESISNGYISDELSPRVRNGYDNDWGRNLRREFGEELQVDTGKSSNNQSGISQKDGHNRELGKTSRELDSYAPTFYSQMAKVVDNVKQDKLAANSVVNMLRGKGVKAEEIKWSGIEAFLEGKKSVTKAELQEFIAGSQLEIEEEMSGEDIDLRYDGSNRAYNLYDENGNIVDTFTYNEFLGGYVAASDEEIYSNSIELEEALREEYGNTSAPRWADHKLDGGTNYRELVFKMPNSSYSNSAMQAHWSDVGILAHARIQDFDVDGKKMLFVEEIQSDWHNAGQKYGYDDKGKGELNIARRRYRELERESNRLLEELRKHDATKLSPEEKRTIADDYTAKDNAIMAEREALLKKYGKDIYMDAETIPDAPFHDNYHEYVLKRLIREAAEKGYDSIGWTTADTQSQRWSDQYAEGYRIEYDQDIPSFLKKYGKKWGATVGKADLDGTTVWSMPITDAMKQSVLYEGQSRFSRELDSLGNELTKEQAELFKDSKVRDAEGNLLVMYHGTNADFTIFDTKKSNQSNWFGEGSYFTSIEEEASFYGNNVVKAYLNITNPYIPTADKILEDGTVKFAPSFKDDLKNRFVELKNTDKISTSQITEILTDEGYDGILVGDVAVIFDSNQAKLTTNKAPTSNPDIRYSRELDIDYMTAVEQGDMETAQKMVDEAAKKAGYTVKGYHGSHNSFTIFDEGKSGLYGGFESRIGFWFGTTKKGAENWANETWGNTPQVYDCWLKIEKPKVFTTNEVDPASVELLNKEIQNAENEYKNLYEQLRELGIFATWTVSDYIRSNGNSTIANSHNMDQETFLETKQIAERLVSYKNELKKLRAKRGDLVFTDSYEQFKTEIYKMVGMDAEDANVGGLGRKISNDYEVIKKYKENLISQGYDSIIIRDTRFDADTIGEGKRTDQIVVFDSKQIKSADPVTYDDDGNVIPLSQRFNPENNDIRYSRDLETEGDVAIEATPVSNRSLLTNALLDTAQSDIEYKKLDDYKAVIGYLEAEEVKLADLKRKIYDATFGDGDKSKLKELREEARKTEARIDLHDRKLLQLESTTALKNVLERAKKQAYSKALEKGREAMHRNVEGRYKTIERNKIKKIAHELDTLLNKGNKKRNVKIEAQGVVRAALDLRDMYFTSDDELVMNGIKTEATDKEVSAMEQYKALYEKLHATDDDVTNNKEDRAELRREMNEIKKDFAELLERERKRINNTKAKTVYNALIEEYEKLANSPSRHIAQAFDTDTLNHIKTLRDNVGENLVSEMTLEQIKDVYKAFKMVKTMVTNSNKLFNENLKESVDALGNTALHEIEKHGHKEKFTKVGKTASEFSWNNLKPVYLMERTGSTTLQKLFQKVLDGESVWAKDMLDAREYIEKQKNEYKYDNWDFKKTYEFSTPSGKTFKLNLEQIMTIYAYSKRGEQAIEHLRTDGFVFDKVVVKKKGIEFELNDKSAYKITDEARIKMIGLLTQDQKAYVDAMQKYLSKTMGAKGNEVSKAMYGIELYGEENYLPIHSEGAYLERAREQAKGDVKLKNKGFTKSTVKHARNAIVLSDFDKLCTEHIAEMSSYHAFTLPLEDFYKVYNYQVDSDDVADKRGVIPALENAYGKGATGAIDQLLTDLNGGARGDSRETIAKKSIALYKKAKVMLSLSVVIQQPSSIIRAQAMIDPKYFVGQKIGDTKRKELWAEMKKYAPVTIIKEMGYFDVGMGKASADWLLDDPTLSEKIDEIASKPAAKADELTWIAIWNAVKRETASKNTSLNTSSVEFLEKAGERFEDVIRHTQVYDSTLARSGNMRSKSALMQMATSFMAEPTTSLNMREMALRSKDARRIARTTAAIYGATLLNAVLVAIPYAMRDDDEDETFLEKYITALSTSFVDNLNPITSIPFAKDVWSLMQGYNVDRADMSAASDLIDSFKELVQIATKDKEEREQGDIENAIVKLVGTLSSFSGLPIDNVRRDVMSVFNTYKTLTRGYDTTWKSMEDALQRDFQKSTPVWNLFKTESKNEKLYEAILANDDKYVDRFKSTYKDENEYNSALRKAIRDNDPRLEEAALARLNGDRDTYYRLMMDVIDEGNFDKQIIKDAFDAEYNYQKRKAEENK